jgi:small GTP-binding protein
MNKGRIISNPVIMTDYDYTFKIMMLGDPTVPKTPLTIRYISGFFLEDLKLTVGVDFYSKTTNFKGKKVKLQLWDFGGEERFRFLLSQYCKGCNAAMFLYDITKPLTLNPLPDWTQVVREHAGNIPIMLIGLNADLEEYRAISREEGIRAAKHYNLSSFAEVSAKTGQNVEKAFEALTEAIFSKYNVVGEISSYKIFIDINTQINRLMNCYLQWGIKYSNDNPSYISELKKVLRNTTFMRWLRKFNLRSELFDDDKKIQKDINESDLSERKGLNKKKYKSD